MTIPVDQRYIAALTAYDSAPGEKVLFMPLEGAKVIETVNGIQDLGRGARGEG